MEYKEMINADLYRWNSQLNRKTFLKCLIIPQFRFIYLKRKCEQYCNSFKPLFLIYKIIYKHYQYKYGIQIPVKTRIGQGFRIGHINNILINENVIIGDNCQIQNGVTIGYEVRGKRRGTPILGNRVWVGANSVIVGNIKIGNNVLIAPNTFVNFNIPDDSIVINSSRARIINDKNATYKYI
jgi:serine O-acetyltransferase